MPIRENESKKPLEHLPPASGADSEPAKTAKARVDQETLSRVVSKIRDTFQKSNQRLEIEVDSDLHRVIVKIVKGDTDEVIRQIPMQEALELEKRLSDQAGLLIEKHA